MKNSTTQKCKSAGVAKVFLTDDLSIRQKTLIRFKVLLRQLKRIFYSSIINYRSTRKLRRTGENGHENTNDN